MAKKKQSIHPAKYLAPIIVVIGILAVTLGLYGYGLISVAVPIGINEISNATGETVLTFTPAAVNVTVGTDTTLTLTANTGNAKLTILSVELAYDQTKISTPVVTLGSFLPNPMSNPVVANGKITFIVAATPDSGGVTGSGTIAAISFKPTVAGSSSLSFTTKTLSAGLTLAGVRVDANMIKSATDVPITGVAVVQATTTPTDAPAATSTPIPTVAPTSNSVLVVTNTPKPTAKPRTVTATAAPVTTSTDTTYDNTYTTTTTDNNLIPISNEPVGTVTDTTVTKPPSFFKKIMIGWGIIIQYILSLFGIN